MRTYGRGVLVMSMAGYGRGTGACGKKKCARRYTSPPAGWCYCRCAILKVRRGGCARGLTLSGGGAILGRLVAP